MNNQEIRESIKILKSQDTSNIAKGSYNGECNRGACTNKHAYWYNDPMYKYYCIACARMINESSNQSGMGDICTPVYHEPIEILDVGAMIQEVNETFEITNPYADFATTIESNKYYMELPSTGPTATHPIRTTPKIKRNSPCPCESGKKYKKCCINN